MGSLAVEDGRTVSLFMQVLCIAMLLGSILYFLFNKLIEYPIMALNKEVDFALKNKSESTSFNIDFPIFENLISNVNTLLTRVAHIKDEGEKNPLVNKEIEASNLLNMIGYASIALNKDLNIIGVNSAFESMLNVNDASLKNQPLSLIPDQALQKNIIELVQKTEMDPSNIHLSELEFGGVNSQVGCLAISDSSGICYFMTSIVPLTGSGE
jgi:signal transduction histidine kinase